MAWFPKNTLVSAVTMQQVIDLHKQPTHHQVNKTEIRVVLRKAFENQSARIIAFSRATLALVFLGSVWTDSRPGDAFDQRTQALLLTYLLFALVMLRIAWTDWWLNYRLRMAALTIDFAIFLISVYLWERPQSEYFSPFLAFFAFLLLTSHLQCSTRHTVILSALVCTAYAVEGLLLKLAGYGVNLEAYGRRLVYMAVLAVFMIWFGMQRRRLLPERLDHRFNGSLEHLFAAINHYAMGQTRATGAALVWNPDEEPWTGITRGGSLGAGFERIGPLDFPFDRLSETEGVLFNGKRGVALVLHPDSSLEARRGLVLTDLGRFLGVNQGLILPLSTAIGTGALVLKDIPGVGIDHLELGLGLAKEAAGAIEHYAVLNQARNSAATQIRDSIARDLHDSITQTLAGASYRLDAVLSGIKAGRDPVGEVEAIRNDLRNEQLHVRSLIERLRTHHNAPLHSDLKAELHLALGETARQWRIDAHADISTELEPLPTSLVHEVLQIVREAVANAARHGGAVSVEVGIREEEGGLMMTIEDNGEGFASQDMPPNPRSITERVRALGGSLDIDTRPGRTHLLIRLPMGVPE